MINDKDFIDKAKPHVIAHFAPEKKRGAYEYLELRTLADEHCRTKNEKMQFDALWLSIEDTITNLNEQQD